MVSIVIATLCLLWTFSQYTECVDLASPEVFDPVFYSNNHPEIISQYHTVEKVKQHWLQHGIHNGWQASGQFHSKQYLAKYPDLQKAFNHNYQQAVEHYLVHHKEEQRIGLLSSAGNFEGRWTVVSNGIYVSSSTRMGGAIDSVTWNNKEFINTRDHGRQMQMACNTNKYTECYNPTEAGGLCDHVHQSTHTQINWVRVHGNVMESMVHPAFWKGVQPTSGTHHNCPSGSFHTYCPIHNGYYSRYSYPFQKKVIIGTHNIANCIEYISNFTIGGNWPQDADLYIQFEAPAVYMTYEFTEQYTFNPTTRLSERYHSTKLPVILSTHDKQHAMGCYAPDGQDTDRPKSMLVHNFQLSTFADSTSKFDTVFYKRPHGTDVRNYVYRNYICIGTLDMVSNCLHQIMIAVPR